MRRKQDFKYDMLVSQTRMISTVSWPVASNFDESVTWSLETKRELSRTAPLSYGYRGNGREGERKKLLDINYT